MHTLVNAELRTAGAPRPWLLSIIRKGRRPETQVLRPSRGNSCTVWLQLALPAICNNFNTSASEHISHCPAHSRWASAKEASILRWTPNHYPAHTHTHAPWPVMRAAPWAGSRWPACAAREADAARLPCVAQRARPLPCCRHRHHCPLHPSVRLCLRCCCLLLLLQEQGRGVGWG